MYKGYKSKCIKAINLGYKKKEKKNFKEFIKYKPLIKHKQSIKGISILY